MPTTTRSAAKKRHWNTMNGPGVFYFSKKDKNRLNRIIKDRKLRSQKAKANYNKRFDNWHNALNIARREVGVARLGFGEKGKLLLKRAREVYTKNVGFGASKKSKRIKDPTVDRAKKNPAKVKNAKNDFNLLLKKCPSAKRYTFGDYMDSRGMYYFGVRDNKAFGARVKNHNDNSDTCAKRMKEWHKTIRRVRNDKKLTGPDLLKEASIVYKLEQRESQRTHEQESQIEEEHTRAKQQKEQRARDMAESQSAVFAESPNLFETMLEKVADSRLVDYALSGLGEEKDTILIWEGINITYKTIWQLTYEDAWQGEWTNDMIGNKKPAIADPYWLSSSIIEFYLKLLEMQTKHKSSKILFMLDFFYEKLTKSKPRSRYEYKQVERWTKNEVVMKKYKKIIVPINHDKNHWALAVMDTENKRVVYYDSLYGRRSRQYKRVTSNLIRWIGDDTKQKVKDLHEDDRISTDSEEWETWFGYNDEGCPQQENGNDCGVFVCMFALHVIHDSRMWFKQEDITSCRRMIAHEILTVNDPKTKNQAFFDKAKQWVRKR